MRWLVVSVAVLATFSNVLGQFPDFCDLPAEHGPGTEVIVLLYYDKANDRCNPFLYGGKGGNENRFLTDRMCMHNCSSRAADLYPADEREACHLRKDYGHCLSRYFRWYYDPVRGKCKAFHYTGCGGNGNRFASQLLCNTTCVGIQDPGDMDEEDSDTPVGLIIGIVLGVHGAIILIVTIIVVVKSENPKSKETKVIPKEDDSPLQTDVIEMKKTEE